MYQVNHVTKYLGGKRNSVLFSFEMQMDILLGLIKLPPLRKELLICLIIRSHYILLHSLTLIIDIIKMLL